MPTFTLFTAGAQVAPAARRPCRRKNRRAATAIASASSSGYDLAPGVHLPAPIGIGCWSWGNTAFWNDSWTAADEADARGAYRAALANDLVFFDTAEAYNGPENAQSMGGFAQGAASSEQLLGDMLRMDTAEGGARPLVCTKFSALPWRLGPDAVVEACLASLDRLKVPSVDAYMIHWPGVWQNDEYAEGLARCVEMGLTKCVGVSNHNVAQMRNAHGILAKHGVPLAFNQCQYSLTYNNAETNGMLDAVKELDMTLMAYSPLQSGLLSGKYSSSVAPAGPRGQLYGPLLAHLDALLGEMRDVGEQHGGKSPLQVALNYLVCQGNVLPIPGAKTAAQAQEFAGAVGWALDAEEVKALRASAAAARKAATAESLPLRLLTDALYAAQL